MTVAPLAWVAAVVPSTPRMIVKVFVSHGGDQQNFTVDLDAKIPSAGNVVASVTVQLVAVVVVIAADKVVTA